MAVVRPQVSLFKLEHGVLEYERDDGDRHFAVSCAKIARAAKNAEMRYNSNLRHRRNSSKSDLILLVKHYRQKALQERVFDCRRFWDADDRTSSLARADNIISIA